MLLESLVWNDTPGQIGALTFWPATFQKKVAVTTETHPILHNQRNMALTALGAKRIIDNSWLQRGGGLFGMKECFIQNKPAFDMAAYCGKGMELFIRTQ